MRVLLDINVILDAMRQRPPWHKEADAILQAAAQGQVICATTALSLATIFYVGRKVVGTPPARAAVRQYLTAFDILSIDKQTLLDADGLAGSDFEDNILIAAAVASSLDAIVTRNPGDFCSLPDSSLGTCRPVEATGWREFVATPRGRSSDGFSLTRGSCLSWTAITIACWRG